MNHAVFISYWHDDRKWLDKLQKMLKPLLRNNPIAVWDDTKIRPGAKWKEEIEKALNNADAAILLVSPNFLASDFITRKEVPALLDSAQTKGVTIIWIPISDCLWMETDIANYQAAYPPATPLDSLNESEVNQQTISCPHCGQTIELTEAFTHQVEEKLRVEYEKRIFAERTAAANKMRQETEQRLSLELKDLRAQNEEKERRLREAEENELELRKQRREIEEREKNMQLELQRMMDEERKKVWIEAATKAAEDHRLKDAEKDRKLEETLRQLEDTKRRLEQGSQQAQGEVLEIELENLLRLSFPTDEVLPVPKGTRGADVVQRVITQRGNFCGTILWESKRTKDWNKEWIQKLKDDQRQIKAELAIIVSVIMPKEIKHIGFVEGVWISDFESAVGLAMALRSGLYDVAKTRAASVGKNEKMELVYAYLSGKEFRQRIELVIEAYREVKRGFDQERIALQKIWGEREKQLLRMITGTVMLYGELQGIIGAALPPLPQLELPPADGDLFDQ